jgi:hemerythrin-like metal-binding protein
MDTQTTEGTIPPKGWDVILDVLRDVRPPIGMQGLLEAVIEKLQTVHWLSLEQRGAILLLGSCEELILVAKVGMEGERAIFCEKTDKDRCACGEVVDTSEIAFMPCVGETTFDSESNHVILPLLDGERTLGVMPLFVPQGHQPSEAEISLLRDLSYVLSSIVSRLLMDEIVNVKQLELEETKAEAIQTLGVASEYRDSETGMHVIRMANYANELAKAMGIALEEREKLLVAAPMHDVGKIGISDTILLKPARLGPEEFDLMKSHTRIGERILKGDDELMKIARVIALNHHEKWDGTGYPNAKKGENIPLLGQICAVADVFDALTSRRPYKEPWAVDEAIKYINDETGKSFSPAIVDAFNDAVPGILRIKELYRDSIINPHEKLELPPIPETKSTWIPWNDALNTGIDVVDEHHRYLIMLINDLYVAVNESYGCRKVVRTLKSLEHYSTIHFREEERMMREYSYRRLGKHIHQHDIFRDNIAKSRADLKTNPLTLGYETLFYLRSWLTNHIMKEDALLHELTTIEALPH